MIYLCPKLKDMNIERLRIYDKCLRSNKKHTAKELMDKINAVRVDKFIS